MCVCLLRPIRAKVGVSLPAAISMEHNVGEPCPAARCSAVFPPKEVTLTSAFSCRDSDDVITVSDFVCVCAHLCRSVCVFVTSVMRVQATLNRFSLTARCRAVLPLFSSGALILAPPSTSSRRQRSPSRCTARCRGWSPATTHTHTHCHLGGSEWGEVGIGGVSYRGSRPC